MTNKIHLWPEEKVETNGTITLGVTIEKSSSERSRLWYRVPIEYQAAVTAGCEPFVLGTLFTSMRWAADLVVHGQVSPSLLRNLAEFQSAWASWRPKLYHQVEIAADIECEQPGRNSLTDAVVAFSGGVDSCFTVWRHQTGHCGRLKRNIQAGVMVHGFDIPLPETDVFKRASERSEKMLTSLGVALIPIATNFRELGDEWEDVYSIGLASCLMLLQGSYASGLIASSDPYSHLVIPWGSNPITDPLLSSDSFGLILDGAAFTRSEKIRYIAQWPEALQHLRVCWQGKHKDRNCGRCEKCIRTILTFRLLGLGLPECFEQDVTDQQLLSLRGLRPETLQFGYLEEILAAVRAASISESWVGALEQCLLQNRSGSNGKPGFRQQLRKKIPLTLRRSIRRLIG